MLELSKFIKAYKKLIPPSIFIFLSVLLLIFAPFLDKPFSRIFSVATYLAWHNLLEMSTSTAFIAIFLVTYFTYSQTKRLKTMLIGVFLYVAGMVDAFHMLSYLGMPAFFIVNIGSNRATTFWIISRLFLALGFLIGGNIHPDIKSRIKNVYFFFAGTGLVVAIFIVVTYFPSLLPVMYVEGQGLTLVKKVLEYVVMLMLLISSITYFRNGIRLKDTMLKILACSLFLCLLSELSFTLYDNVYGIYNYLGHIIGTAALFMAVKNTIARNVLEPFAALSDAQLELSEHVKNQEVIIEQRTHQLKKTNAKLLEDLEYARDIQKSMLPSYLPDSDKLSIQALYMPTERISGDFYDIFMYDESHIGFYVSDVSGHGVPAAMLTVFLKQYIDSVIEVERHKETLPSPSDVLHQVFDAFNNSNFKDDVYIVLILCIYDQEQRKLTLSSAGMNVMPLKMDRDGKLEELSLKGFPICKLSGVCDEEFQDYHFMIEKGERLFLFTDGLSEAKNANGEQYSFERLKTLIESGSSKALSEQIGMISDDLLDFSAKNRLEDDATLLAVEFKA